MYQNQGICYITIAYCCITKMFVARNKFSHIFSCESVPQH